MKFSARSLAPILSEWRLLYSIMTSTCMIILEVEAIMYISVPFFSRFSMLKGLYKGVSGWNYGVFDGSDKQYGKFRLSLMDLTCYFLLLIVGGYIWRKVFRINENPPKLGSHPFVPDQPNQSYNLLLVFYVIHGLGFLYVTHANTIFYVLLVLAIFYWISTLKGSVYNPILSWVFALLVLVTCELYSGYKISPWLVSEDHWLAQFLDANRGDLRWHVYYRITMLKALSFNLDKYWAYNNAPVFQTNNDFVRRNVIHLPFSYYTLQSFFVYTSYTPLYIAGPIVSFNNFVTQLVNPIPGARKEAVKNIIWTTFLVILLDVLMHYSCLYAISVSYAWERFNEPWQVGWVGFWSMQFMYMKYLVIWRYFRTVSLVDGVVPPENMPRCMHNNCTFTGFWRSWHASFNQWSLRYLYIPLGGKKTQQYSIWLIFFFIGLWHDLWWSWIAWALLNCICFSIEIAVMKYWAKPKFDPIRNTWWVETIIRLAQGWNIVLLLLSNLCIIYGFEYMPLFIKLSLWSPGSWKVYLFVTICLTGGAILQAEVKKREFKTLEYQKRT